jgi:cation diffusion facilitator family transporter
MHAKMHHRINKNEPDGGSAKGRINNVQAEIKKSRNRALFSVFLNLLLAAGKTVAGVMGGSTALIGDGIHSATDVIASAAAFVGLWLAGKKHPAFPYGLYKAETLATLVTAVMVILAGYEIGRRALLEPKTLPNVALTLPVALISLLVTLVFGFYQLRAGRQLHSRALEADARDYLADGLSTTAVVIGLLGAFWGFHLDRWAAGIVALFVFWSGGQLLWRAVGDLMDEAIDRETERRIISLVESHPKVQRVERCLSRTAGGRFIIELDVIFRSHSLDLAHRIAHRLEDEIRARFPLVIIASVKIHSREPDHIRRIIPVKAPKREIEAHFARAPWFLVQTIERKSGRVIGSEYIQNPHLEAQTKRGFLVGKWLLELKPDQVIVAERKEGTVLALLEEASVEIIESHDTSIT